MRRRDFLLSATGGLLLGGCRSVQPAAPVKPLTEEEQRYKESRERMLKKFDRHGFELVVDAVKGQVFLGVEFFAVGAKEPFYRKSTQRLTTRTNIASMSVVPERVRVVWRDSNEIAPGGGQHYAGKIIGDEVIEVGSRIPQEIVAALRDRSGTIKITNLVGTKEFKKGGAGLRVKLRMFDQGTLLGWEIERRPTWSREVEKEERKQGRNVYHAPAYSMIGGDFKEARPAEYYWEGGDSYIGMPDSLPTPVSDEDKALLDKYHLMVREKSRIRSIPPTPSNYRSVWEKGWYIDRKTGQKIWTDY